MSLFSFHPHCSGNGHDLRRNAAGEWACDACGYVVGADECPPAGASQEVNEVAPSLAAPSASGQQAGTPLPFRGVFVPFRRATYGTASRGGMRTDMEDDWQFDCSLLDAPDFVPAGGHEYLDVAGIYALADGYALRGL